VSGGGRLRGCCAIRTPTVDPSAAESWFQMCRT
jgi:hypothetical protein